MQRWEKHFMELLGVSKRRAKNTGKQGIRTLGYDNEISGYIVRKETKWEKLRVEAGRTAVKYQE